MGWHSAAIGGLVAQAAQWPPIDPLRHGTPICFDGDGHSFEECCNQETFGPWGNPECFEGIFSYELCCLPDWKSRNTEVRACDWVQFAQDYKEQAQNSEDPPGEAEEILSQNDQLYEESCCMTYQAEQNLCWGYLPHLRRRLPGTNLSWGYVSCCYDHLQALLEARRNGAPDPAWLQKEMEAEMPTEYSPVRHQDPGEDLSVTACVLDRSNENRCLSAVGQ
ncbi:unnamed protein product [Effrenium voratum]|nr:unnamed protein product [Effrenium voratum]